MLAPALALVSAASCKRDFITFPCLCPTSPTQQAFDTASSWLYSSILNSVLAEFASPPPFTHPCCPHRPSRRPPAPPLSSPPLQAPNPRPHLAPPPRVPPAIRGPPTDRTRASRIYTTSLRLNGSLPLRAAARHVSVNRRARRHGARLLREPR
jgi:hypothetical protein